uniref:PH-interacting protein-like n=3 Tax=Saliceae TaxID=238069 RepID=A0A4U5MNH3_POPAL|nr:PH-interacting protein-like [Populus alba]
MASTTFCKPLPDHVLPNIIDVWHRAFALDSKDPRFCRSKNASWFQENVPCRIISTSHGYCGFIEQTDVFQASPPSLQARPCSHLASKSTPAAREDSTKGDPSGNIGICLRVEVLKKIEKLLKPHPVRLPTPLPIPSDASQSKKTRGGRRLRKNRERYAMTDMRNLANKIHFGVPEESSLDGGLGAADYGMLLFLIEDGNPMDGGGSIETDSSLQGMPKKQTLEFILDILQRRDTQEIFAQPVDPDEVVGYYDIIKEPMDFGTIRAKLQEGMYTSLDQFQRDVFLISSNAMKFNSSTTVYYSEARAISELAQRVFNSLRTEPEKFVLEHSRMRRHPAQKGHGQTGSVLNKLVKLAGFRDGASLNSTSLKRATQTHPASTRLNPLVDHTKNEMPSGSRDGRNLESSETARRMTYMPQTSSINGKGSIISELYNTPKVLTPIPDSSIRYKESLKQFVKDLGPTAQMVANKKLGKHPIETPNFASWMPTSSSKKTNPVPVSSALNRPACLTGVTDGRMPRNSFNSISPASFEGKMVFPGGGVNGYNTRDMIPAPNCLQGIRAHPNDGGSNNSALMGENAAGTSKNMDACASSEAKTRGTSGNMNLLMATLMQITAFQNRNCQTPSGYFPLTGMYPAQPSQLITEPQPWLNNHSEPLYLPSLSTKLASTSLAATSLPQFDFQCANGEGPSTGAASVVEHKYGAKPPQAVQLQTAERIQPPPPWDPQAVYNNLPIMRKMVSEQQILSRQNALIRKQQSQVASMQPMSLSGTTNFVEGVDSQVHQAKSSGHCFSETQQSTSMDNQQPDLALQL